jgi:DNA processing protein
MDDILKYRIGISLIPGVGPVLARNMIAYAGGVKQVVDLTEKQLAKIPGIGNVLDSAVKSNDMLPRARAEIEFIKKHDITPVFFTDEKYPRRLSQCDDAPLMLYLKGDVDLELRPVLSIVGSRRATDRGKIICEKFIKELAVRYPDVLIVSGLAYGIDICAHRAALKNGLDTIAVVAHGLDRIYPYLHRNEAKEMIEKGGAVVTEFISGTKPDKFNFVQRNRIVAGLADAVVVVESGIKGGALITARIASSYNRDVLAFPGHPSDELSRGCNYLIKKNIAALIENVDDLEYALGWESKVRESEGATQRKLFTEFSSDDEKLLYTILTEEKELTASELCIKSKLPVSRVNSLLLNLEFAGLVKSLPGNAYRVLM